MKKGMLVMEKILKCVGMFMVALVLVMGVGGDADAKKKKKKYKLTDEENAMFDKWHVKPKKRQKTVKDLRKKPKFVGLSGFEHDIHTCDIKELMDWIKEKKPVFIELKVDPNNIPGRSTVFRIVNDWNGKRHIEGDAAITISGLRTMHECYLVEI